MFTLSLNTAYLYTDPPCAMHWPFRRAPGPYPHRPVPGPFASPYFALSLRALASARARIHPRARAPPSRAGADPPGFPANATFARIKQ